jgi:hypothetical protein
MIEKGLPRQRLCFVPIDLTRDVELIEARMRVTKLTDLQRQEILISIRERFPDYQFPHDQA